MAEPESNDNADQIDEEHIRSLVKAHAIFAMSDGSLGSIDAPSKEGFLALARKGAYVWNAWRAAYPHPVADFSAAAFDGKDIDFSGFNFPNPTARGPCVNFSGATFVESARFWKTTFGDNADFTKTKFLRSCSFTRARFDQNADFTGSKIIGYADFHFTDFGDSASFSGCSFDADMNFFGATFSGSCFFNRAKLANRANFMQTVFSKFATFYASEFGFETHFVGAIFVETVDLSADTGEDFPAKSGKFQHLSFNGATFRSRARFTNRQFLATTDFGILRSKNKEAGEPLQDRPTKFMGIPDFHGCKFHQDTSFDGAIFETPLNQEAARAFRTLKLAMEQLKATREEQRFFRLEMKAEHPSLPLGKRWISTLYNLFSDYGFSLWRPIAWLLALSLLFGMGYGILANACAADTECAQLAWAANTGSAADRTSAAIKYTLASVSPVPGLDKMQTELRAPLFGHHGWIPITALVLEILHKIVALVMAFLFALALRNLFKMKS